MRHHHLTIQNEDGQEVHVPLSPEADRDVGKLLIDGVPYHVERVNASTLQRLYRVDVDKDYAPQHDRSGKCVIIAPYSKG